MGRNVACVSEMLALVEALTGCSSSRFEVAQVIRYRPEEIYAWHLDTLPESSQGSEGNRVATFLIYLSDGGGYTAFRDLVDVHVAPVLGTAMLFFPCFGSDERRGQPDFRTVHSSLSASGGETKYIAQVFIRERAFAGGYASIPGY